MKRSNVVSDFISSFVYDVIKGNHIGNIIACPVLSKIEIMEYRVNKKIYRHNCFFKATDFFNILKNNNNQESSWLITYLIKNKHNKTSLIQERFLITEKMSEFNFKCYHSLDDDYIDFYFVTRKERQKFIDYYNEISTKEM